MKILRYFTVLVALVILLPACSLKYGFPSASPGTLILCNATRADREIRIIRGRYSLRQLKEIILSCRKEVRPIAVKKIGWANKNDLVFISEDATDSKMRKEKGWANGFTIPYSCVQFKNGRMASQTAFVYLRPFQYYTIYVKNYRGRDFLGEYVTYVRPDAVYEKRRTLYGPIFADDIVDLKRVDTRGMKQFRLRALFTP